MAIPRTRRAYGTRVLPRSLQERATNRTAPTGISRNGRRTSNAVGFNALAPSSMRPNVTSAHARNRETARTIVASSLIHPSSRSGPSDFLDDVERIQRTGTPTKRPDNAARPARRLPTPAAVVAAMAPSVMPLGSRIVHIAANAYAATNAVGTDSEIADVTPSCRRRRMKQARNAAPVPRRPTTIMTYREGTAPPDPRAETSREPRSPPE